MDKIIFLSAVYVVCGFLMLVGIWRLYEDEDYDFQRKPRSTRIAVRMAVLFLWPIPFAIMAIAGIYNLFKYLWETITK